MHIKCYNKCMTVTHSSSCLEAADRQMICSGFISMYTWWSSSSGGEIHDIQALSRVFEAKERIGKETREKNKDAASDMERSKGPERFEWTTQEFSKQERSWNEKVSTTWLSVCLTEWWRRSVPKVWCVGVIFYFSLLMKLLLLCLFILWRFHVRKQKRGKCHPDADQKQAGTRTGRMESSWWLSVCCQEEWPERMLSHGPFTHFPSSLFRNSFNPASLFPFDTLHSHCMTTSRMIIIFLWFTTHEKTFSSLEMMRTTMIMMTGSSFCVWKGANSLWGSHDLLYDLHAAVSLNAFCLLQVIVMNQSKVKRFGKGVKTRRAEYDEESVFAFIEWIHHSIIVVATATKIEWEGGSNGWSTVCSLDYELACPILSSCLLMTIRAAFPGP